MIDLGNAPTGTPPDSGEKTQLRSALGLAIGTDVQAFDAKLVTQATLNPMYVASFRNVTVLTSGAPADIASITLPAWLTGYAIIPIGGMRTIAESASGTLAGAQFIVRTGPSGTGAVLNVTASGPASTSVVVGSNASSTPRPTGSTLYLHQSANSANAGVISVYLILMPLL